MTDEPKEGEKRSSPHCWVTLLDSCEEGLELLAEAHGALLLWKQSHTAWVVCSMKEVRFVRAEACAGCAEAIVEARKCLGDDLTCIKHEKSHYKRKVG